ncbi:beta-lactamase family protein [Desulfurispirillum indicum]|uniref:serine hydrolase domain-containing protein n=1 Tax=Desulfurispirillum indicum TaxID=936456 RepID=UPI001CFAF1A5|nr:serine hydrolase domain-containing protein [Desulfurispirillum indicum]UCZ56974.1 beta-lactamase family protein [Desulfurispirillum indicum]
MHTDAALSVLNTFLDRSPRSAVEVQVRLGHDSWSWRHGDVEGMELPVFEVGSVGKLFTTTLLALLVQRGELGLTDPVSRFFPQFPWAANMTLHQLATHTSGLPRDVFPTWQMLLRGRQLAEAFGPDDLGHFLLRQPRVLRGAGKMRYSNVGMALLGRILAEACGKSYGDAVRELILEPLGMRDTAIDHEGYPAERLVQGHDSRGRRVPPFQWRGMEPAGVWRSTGEDMMKFLLAQMGASGEPWVSLAGLMVQPQATVGRGTWMGLGWMLSQDSRLGRVAWHSGGTFGQHAMAGWSLDIPVAIMILTNRIPPWWHHLSPGRSLEGLPQKLLVALAPERFSAGCGGGCGTGRC